MPLTARNHPGQHRVVIVGGGMAGARLAHQLDQLLGPDRSRPTSPPRHRITVLAEEPHPAYNRVLLTDVLAGRYGAELIGLPVPERRVRWRGGVRVVRIDRAARQVVCASGERVPYDALVLATGSSPALPPLRGLEPSAPDHSGARALPHGVLTFRTLDDCRALADAVREGCPAAVVGGGPLGVATAHALVRRGARVTLSHRGPELMGRHLDRGAAEALRRHLTGLGVTVYTGQPVRAVVAQLRDGGSAAAHARADRSVRAVELSDGRRLPAEVVVLACGVRPRVGLARAAGLSVARGVVVDDTLTTDDPRVHALGDCAEHHGVVYGRAAAAQEQADLLARVLATRLSGGGAPAARGERYTGTRALTRLTLAAPPPRASPVQARRHARATAPSGGTRPKPGPLPASVTSLCPGALAANGAVTDRARGAGPALAGGPFDLASCGETEPRPDDHVIQLSDAARGVHRVVVLRDGRLVGGVLLGDLGTVGALARAWESAEPLPSASPLHLLTTYGGS